MNGQGRWKRRTREEVERVESAVAEAQKAAAVAEEAAQVVVSIVAQVAEETAESRWARVAQVAAHAAQLAREARRMAAEAASGARSERRQLALEAAIAGGGPGEVRQRAGGRNRYFERLGNIMGRWSTVAGDWRRSSTSGKRYMREIEEHWLEKDSVLGSVRSYADDLFALFLRVRGIEGHYHLMKDHSPLKYSWLRGLQSSEGYLLPAHALVYRFQGPSVARTGSEDLRYYLHGSFFHTLWQITLSGMFMDSNTRGDEGHEASTPGLYMTDSFNHGLHYGWATNLFGDGLFYRMMYVVEADYRLKRHEKRNTQTAMRLSCLLRVSPLLP